MRLDILLSELETLTNDLVNYITIRKVFDDMFNDPIAQIDRLMGEINENV